MYCKCKMILIKQNFKTKTPVNMKQKEYLSIWNGGSTCLYEMSQSYFSQIFNSNIKLLIIDIFYQFQLVTNDRVTPHTLSFFNTNLRDPPFLTGALTPIFFREFLCWII